MIEKKLKIDLSGLWDNPHGFFTLRYQDLNEEKRTQLATRIKLVAPQSKIRSLYGPEIEDIKQTLFEINPIIFSENQEANNGYRVQPINSCRRFNTLSIIALGSYRFRELCQAIYKINCVKRNLTENEIRNIADLSSQNYTEVTSYLEARLPRNANRTIEERISLIQDIGIEDIRNARERAESNGADNIPDGMYDNGQRINNIEFDPFDITENEMDRRIELGVDTEGNTTPTLSPVLGMNPARRMNEGNILAYNDRRWIPSNSEEEILPLPNISRERIEQYRTDIERIRAIPTLAHFYEEDEQGTIDQLVENTIENTIASNNELAAINPVNN